MADLKKLSDAKLDNMIERAQQELTRRKIEKLLRQRCACDRYTCIRCRMLSGLGHTGNT